MKKSYYQYFQPNEKAKQYKDQVGDCVIRALSGCLGQSWVQVFDALLPMCREFQCVPNESNLKIRKMMFERLGLRYNSAKVENHHRPTVQEFAKAHPTGRYVCRVANHLVAVVDGKYLDTWDSGSKSVYGYFTK